MDASRLVPDATAARATPTRKGFLRSDFRSELAQGHFENLKSRMRVFGLGLECDAVQARTRVGDELGRMTSGCTHVKHMVTVGRRMRNAEWLPPSEDFAG
jgi:hypothetical protein